MSKISRLQKLILRWAEMKLLPDRLKAEQIKRKSEYQEQLPNIETYLGRANCWHGTGRYHYRYDGESRCGVVSASELIDVLKGIIQHNGLVPHQDAWIDSGGKTVSLGTARMHSRAFARLHLYEKDCLLYELGSARYWTRLYIVLLLLWVSTNLESTRQLAKIFSRRSWYKDVQTWGSAIRKPQNGKMRIWTAITGNVADSDIEMNYPILIGVDKGALEVIGTMIFTQAVEVRTLQPVTLSNFTHIEVPLLKVKETEELLKTNGISLQVLPMEFVDAYVSDLPLRTLAYT